MGRHFLFISNPAQQISPKDHSGWMEYSKVLEDEQKEYLRIYDNIQPEEVVKYLFDNNIIVNELNTSKISLEEYYINLMKTKEVK